MVFVPVMDDEHKEIFESLAELQAALAEGTPAADIRRLTQVLIGRIQNHFAHEERLMRAARYGSMQWHKKSHDAARKRVGQFVKRIEEGEAPAAPELIEYLTAWLNEHMRLADMMLGAFLRNHTRSMYKMTFQAGTKAADACAWVDADGQAFDPSATHTGC